VNSVDLPGARGELLAQARLGLGGFGWHTATFTAKAVSFVMTRTLPCGDEPPQAAAIPVDAITATKPRPARHLETFTQPVSVAGR
jgi:hypothetical protein